MQDFLRHIKSGNQKFKCYLNSDESETLSLTVDIYNELNPGATDEEISMLTKLIPDNNEQIVAFYKLYNGITHEFFGMALLLPEAKEAQAMAASALKAAFNK